MDNFTFFLHPSSSQTYIFKEIYSVRIDFIVIIRYLNKMLKILLNITYKTRF